MVVHYGRGDQSDEAAYLMAGGKQREWKRENSLKYPIQGHVSKDLSFFHSVPLFYQPPLALNAIEQTFSTWTLRNI